MRALLVGLLAAIAGCNNLVGIGDLTTAADAPVARCTANETRACYDGAAGTEGKGPCHGGNQTCGADGTWGPCDGQVLPVAEICGNGVDENCSGAADEDVDADGDGYTSCGGDCCDSTECGSPAAVNPAAFEVPGNNLDDDCDGTKDNPPPTCDQAIASDTANAQEFARALDLCRTTTEDDPRWGVISATWSLSTGTGLPDARGHAVRAAYGTNLLPRRGAALGLVSTGVAADEDDTNPAFPGNSQTDHAQSAAFPADWLAANGNVLPNAPGCPAPNATMAYDPVMLTLRVRVPSNARSFAFDSSFYTWEFPEWACSPYNDFYVALLDSGWTGAPGNPPDKNLAQYIDLQHRRWPVGVNLAIASGGLFRQCVNGPAGCSNVGGPQTMITSCVSTMQLAGTGFQKPEAGQCDGNALAGGATGWLTTSGNVVPGEIITLRIAVWDTSDGIIDSTVVLDNFRWSTDSVEPGTVAN